MSQEDDVIYIPWTEEQVKNLTAFQNNQHVHPYTCGTEDCRTTLIATVNGWQCPVCGYRQGWALKAAADPAWANYDPFKPKAK